MLTGFTTNVKSYLPLVLPLKGHQFPLFDKAFSGS